MASFGSQRLNQAHQMTESGMKYTIDATYTPGTFATLFVFGEKISAPLFSTRDKN